MPDEIPLLGMTSGGDFHALKGTIEAIVARLNSGAAVEVAEHRLPLLNPARCCKLTVDGDLLGYLGELSSEGMQRFELRDSSTVAELRLDVLYRLADLVPQYKPLPTQPAIERDLNLVVAENVRWTAVAEVVRAAGGPLLESLAYRDTYRDPQRLGEGKKSILLSLRLRDPQATLTSALADEICERVVARCGAELDARLRA